MRPSVIAGVAAVALLAGCGAASSGEASKSPRTVIRDAERAGLAARSVRVSGISINYPGQTLDLSLVNGRGAVGSIVERNDGLAGIRIDVIKIGDAFYVRSNDASPLNYGSGVGRLSSRKWVKAPAAMERHSVWNLTDYFSFIRELAFMNGTQNRGETSFRGKKVVEIHSKVGDVVYVAATGKPYLVAIVFPARGGDGGGSVTFSDWNKPVSLAAPKGAITPRG